MQHDASMMQHSISWIEEGWSRENKQTITPQRPVAVPDDSLWHLGTSIANDRSLWDPRHQSVDLTKGNRCCDAGVTVQSIHNQHIINTTTIITCGDTNGTSHGWKVSGPKWTKSVKGQRLNDTGLEFICGEAAVSSIFLNFAC